jgi:hypothetical protein
VKFLDGEVWLIVPIRFSHAIAVVRLQTKNDRIAVKRRLRLRARAFKPWWTETEIVLFNWPSAASKVTLNDKRITTTHYDAVHNALRIRIPDQTAAAELRITKQ